MRRYLRRVTVAIGALLILIQLVPYGRGHTNPPVRREPAWDSPATRALAARACFDCHSNQTAWPWYSNVAPVSWLVQHDVDEGRRKLNFSEWDRPQREAHDSAKEVRKGEMPPWYYAIPSLHRITSAERTALVAGLDATLGRDRPREEGRARHGARR